MDQLSTIIGKRFPISRPSPTGASDPFDQLAYEKRRAELFNSTVGSLNGYDCPRCQNRGAFAYLNKDGTFIQRRCSCMAIREAQMAMKKSGLPKDFLLEATFDLWAAPDKWQRVAARIARDYVSQALSKSDFSSWFFMGGRSGSGKTKLCSTVFRALVEGGVSGRYLSWRDYARRAKAVGNDRDRFEELFDQATKPRLIYVDDLFKGAITPADVNLAFEILNGRYMAGKLTIVSSELTANQMLQVDEAVGSRLVEMTEGFYVDCSRARNWRLTNKPSRGTHEKPLASG